MDAKLVIFDFDGTLADTQSIILKTYGATIESLQLPIRKTPELQATIGLPLHQGFEQLYPDMDKEGIDKCVDTYRTIFNKNKEDDTPELFPGVVDTLELLKSRDMLMTIASSRTHDTLLEFCKENKIESYFALILGADDVERHKPDPWPVKYTLEKLHIAAEDAVVVGDMPYDIKMGMDAGCRTVGVTYGNSNLSDLTQAGANRVISRIDLLPDLEL
ncbi:MAG: HAD family hydrolase [Muribaculum sp.]|nr:HAD family hydrolase [Muribaculaceae bacterium]MCM1081277.1 HAD family hydrolase [Muribaculum sp.]